MTGYCQNDEEEDEGDQLVEGLADYYEALKLGDKASIIGQEETMLAQYQIKTFSDEQFKKLKVADTADTEKIIMGVASYRLLEDMIYQQAYQYEPARKQDDGSCRRDDVILISTQAGEDPKNCVNEPLQQDITYLAVNLAYVPENKRRTFNMDTSEGKPIFS